MRTDASHMCASTGGTALCLACRRPLESHRQTVLDIYIVELWWCRGCNLWWGSGSSQRDSNDRAVFCRTSPAALAARLDRLASVDEPHRAGVRGGDPAPPDGVPEERPCSSRQHDSA